MVGAMLTNLKVTAIALAVGLGAGALGSWYLTAEYKDSVWGKVAADQKVEAAAQLQAATQQAIEVERRHNALADQLEVKHAENQQALDRILADNRRLARELGGLRDPGRRPSCGGSVSTATATASESEGGTTGAELSAEASEFLLEFARDADRAAEYANTCHRWIEED